MTGVKYVVAVFASVILVVLVLYGVGGNIGVIIDLISLVLGIGLPLMLLKAGWSFKDMGRAFRSALSEDSGRDALEEARLFFASARVYALFVGGLSFVLSSIVMFRYLEDTSRIGRSISVNLICLFYTLTISLLVCLPLEYAAKRKLLAFKGVIES